MALLKKIEEGEKLEFGEFIEGMEELRLDLYLESNALMWTIFWSVKIEEPKKKNDKNRFMHETWIRTLKKYVRYMRMN